MSTNKSRSRKVMEQVVAENSNDWTTVQQAARRHPRWQDIRRFASDTLRVQGAEEIGTSDISHAVYSLYKSYGGNWDNLLADFDHENETQDVLWKSSYPNSAFPGR